MRHHHQQRISPSHPFFPLFPSPFRRRRSQSRPSSSPFETSGRRHHRHRHLDDATYDRLI